MELEADVETRERVGAVGVQMDGLERQIRTGLHQLAAFRIEEVGVASHFVDGPPAEPRAVVLLGFRVDDAERGVVYDEQPADRVAPRPLARLGHFLELERGDVAVLGQSARHLADGAPPVGRFARHLDGR